jgi:hypothetical protein
MQISLPLPEYYGAHNSTIYALQLQSFKVQHFYSHSEQAPTSKTQEEGWMIGGQKTSL